MDEEEARRLGIPIVFNMREHYEEPMDLYIPFSELMQNIAKRRSFSSSSEEEHTEKPKNIFNKMS